MAGGKVWYFSKFVKPDTTFAADFITENFYLPWWKPVGLRID